MWVVEYKRNFILWFLKGGNADEFRYLVDKFIETWDTVRLGLESYSKCDIYIVVLPNSQCTF